MTVLNYVRGEAQIGAVLLQGGQGHARIDYGRLLAHFVTLDRMPALAAASAAGVFPSGEEAEDRDAAVEESFRFGLTRILDGVNVLLTS
jgi:hypothetical protein